MWLLGNKAIAAVTGADEVPLQRGGLLTRRDESSHTAGVGCRQAGGTPWGDGDRQTEHCQPAGRHQGRSGTCPLFPSQKEAVLLTP